VDLDQLINIKENLLEESNYLTFDIEVMEKKKFVRSKQMIYFFVLSRRHYELLQTLNWLKN